MSGQRRTDLTDLGRLIIASMQDVCVVNKDCPTARTPFHSIQIPPMSLHDYAKRIFKYSQCTEECFPFALVLIMRYLQRQPEGIKLSFYNSHRLFITSLMVAAKLRDDEYYSNAYYSSIGGVSPLEMNALEVQFLKDIQWDLYVDPEEFYSVITACEENLFAEKLEHEVRKFREEKERVERERKEQQDQLHNNIFPSSPMLPNQPSEQVTSRTGDRNSSSVRGGKSAAAGGGGGDSGDSSGGLSSSDSRAQTAPMSTASSGQDMPTMSFNTGSRQASGHCDGEGEDPSGSPLNQSGNNHSRNVTPTTRTPTKHYFDPSNYSNVPQTGGVGGIVGRKRSRRGGKN